MLLLSHFARRKGDWGSDGLRNLLMSGSRKARTKPGLPTPKVPASSEMSQGTPQWGTSRLSGFHYLPPQPQGTQKLLGRKVASPRLVPRRLPYKRPHRWLFEAGLTDHQNWKDHRDHGAAMVTGPTLWPFTTMHMEASDVNHPNASTGLQPGHLLPLPLPSFGC